jgi:hypothetical protein
MTNEVQAALIGASVGGLIALVGTLLAAIFEDKRRLADALRRDSEWRREKCNEAYSQAIYYLFKLQVSSAKNDLSDKDVRQHLSEAQRFLSLLEAYHPVADQRERLKHAAVTLRSGIAKPDSISKAASDARETVESSLQSTYSQSVRSQGS